MKKYLKITIILAIIVGLMGTVSLAQYKKPRKPKGPASHIKVDDEEYSSSGVLIGNSFIKPGDKLPILWGIMGPPDKIWAMRGKDDVNKDYVKLDYYSYGLSFDINSLSNEIQGILVEENNRIFKMKEVPFRIGQEHKIVLQTWGEPENSQPGILAYWRRGVYVGVDDSGVISYLFLTKPGIFEDEENDSKKNKK
ncbi:MAG: hypothetical protein K8T10_05800 [Candidatus Eremiobacteraeota bacterium]|nr:hypothetical protein [Candidatus Eremiobacteraeota bacterium]